MISVLCVDDEPWHLRLAKIFLEQDTDLKVKTVTSAIEGLSILRTGSIDAIVSDYQMPEMNGIEFLKRVRSLDGVPFILFTGKGHEEVAIEAVNNGADFYLQKGKDPQTQFAELALTIKHAVNKRQLEDLLVKSEQKFHTFADYTLDWEYWQSEDNTYVYITPSCEKITGYTPDEFTADPCLLLNIIYPDDRNTWTLHTEEETQSKASHSLEFRIIRKDGEIRWISHRCQPVTDANGKSLGRRSGNRDITDTRRAEEALQRSEERFRMLFQHVPSVAVQGYSADGTTNYWNEASEKLYGYSPVEAIGKNLVDLIIPPEMQDDVREALVYMAETGQPLPSSELSLMRKDGSRVAVFSSHAVIDGLPGGTELFCIDIDLTGRKKAEDALRKSEEKFRNVFDWANDAILLHTFTMDRASSRFIEANLVICHMLGYSREELLTLSPSDIVPPELDSQLSDINRQAQTQNTFLFETRLLRKDGTTFPVESSAQLVIFEGKRIWISHIRDITERKRAEEALQKSEEKFRDLVDNASTIILQTNTEGKIMYFNEFAQKFFGFSEQEIVGRSLIGTIIPGTELIADHDPEYVVKDEIDHPEKYALTETEIIKKDGGRFWVAWRNKPLYDETGTIYGIIRFGLDITDRRNAEKALFQANKKLNLLSSITRHDILNQLTALSGYIELSKKLVRDKKVLDFISREKRAANIIQRLIGFTKDYQDIGQYLPRWQNVHAIVQQQKKNIDLLSTKLAIDFSNLEIFADPLLEKVIYTLLENAMRHGGPPKSIRFSCQVVDKGCLILCEDDGTGIVATDKEKLFSQGFGKHTGFGLFLSQEILGITGFSIQETGTPGKSARFEIFVPDGSFRFIEKTP